MKKTKKVVVAGHLCLDITPIFPNHGTTDISKIMVPGRLIHMDGVEVHTGGIVANTGLALKKLGVDVSLMGKIGDDEFGEMILDVFRKNGYTRTEDVIVDDKTGTSYSVVVAIPGIDRMVLHYLGANNEFYYDDIDFNKVAEADIFHFGYPPLMKSMYENDGEELIKIFKKARELGVVTGCDLAEIDPNSESGRVDWVKYLKGAIPYIDLFLPSFEETCYALDRKRYERLRELASGEDITGVIDPGTDVAPLCDMLMDMGAKIVTIKCGAPGIYYRTAGKEKLAGVCEKLGLDVNEWADREGFVKSFRPEKVLSGVGSGDACVAGFLAAVLKGYSLDRCLDIAAGTGAVSVETYDVLSGIGDISKIEERIDNGWKRNV